MLALNSWVAASDARAERLSRLRAGLGGSKSPEVFGAFPADAYSHTPGHAGAKQPGLTGQVKEDVLCRWGELGVLVEDGRLVFNPLLLGLLFAYMLNPLVEAAEARGVSRSKAVTVLFGVVFLILSLGTLYLTFKAAQGFADVQRQLVGERVLDPEDEHDRSLIDQSLGKPPPPPVDHQGPAVFEPHPHVAFVRSGSEGFFLDRNDDGKRQVGKIEQVTALVSAELGLDGSLPLAEVVSAAEEALIRFAVTEAETLRLTRLGSCGEAGSRTQY